MSQVREGKLFVPETAWKQQMEDKLDTEVETTCPAAQKTRYADGARKVAILCRVTDDHFAVSDNIIAAASFCCGDYGNCPVWRAEKSDDPAIARQRIARERAKIRELTEDQIRRGIRVDDQGLEYEEASARVKVAMEETFRAGVRDAIRERRETQKPSGRKNKGKKKRKS